MVEKQKTPQLENKKLCGWEEAEDEEEEGGVREVCYMVGMLSFLLKSSVLIICGHLSTNPGHLSCPAIQDTLGNLSCPSTTCDSSLILSLNPQSHFANP